jgi:hypothetical protein
MLTDINFFVVRCPSSAYMGWWPRPAKASARGGPRRRTSRRTTSRRRWHHYAVDYLQKNGRIRPISLRAVFFLIAHGAVAPFTLAPFARRFDHTDPFDPNQVAEHAALTAYVITTGLRLDAPGR